MGVQLSIGVCILMVMFGLLVAIDQLLMSK